MKARAPEGGCREVKQTYETPKLVVHGTVEQMTQLLGSASASDAIIYGTLVFDPPGFDLGSQDIVISR
jgi:hypothetical protein